MLKTTPSSVRHVQGSRDCVDGIRSCETVKVSSHLFVIRLIAQAGLATNTSQQLARYESFQTKLVAEGSLRKELWY